MSETYTITGGDEIAGLPSRSGYKLTLSRIFQFYVDGCGPEQILIDDATKDIIPAAGTLHPTIGKTQGNWYCELYAGDASFSISSGESDRVAIDVEVTYSAENPSAAEIAVMQALDYNQQVYKEANVLDETTALARQDDELESGTINETIAASETKDNLETARAEEDAIEEEEESESETEFVDLGSAKNVKTWSTTKYVTVPFLKAYKQGDKKGNPTLDVVHPITKEKIISDAVEKRTVDHFAYETRDWDSSIGADLEGTTNRNAVSVLDKSYAPGMAVIDEVSYEEMVEVDDFGNERTKYKIHVAIERLQKSAIDHELAYRGYMCKSQTSGDIGYIQMKDGAYDIFDPADHTLDVTTPQWVSGSTGFVLQPGNDVPDECYGKFPQIFTEDWSSLNLPPRKSSGLIGGGF